jgi:hypothetical protein
MYEHTQSTDEYIQTQAREFLSLIQLPNSKLYFKTRSVAQKLIQWSTAECLYLCLGAIFSQPRSPSQHEILISEAQMFTLVSFVLTMLYFSPKGLRFQFPNLHLHIIVYGSAGQT